MRKVKFLTSLLIMMIFVIAGCEKENSCDNCEEGILYYTPDCSTINGYVELEKNNETVVFKHDIDERFRKSGVKVCITYNLEQNDTPLTAECTQGQVITIKCIEEN